jgi:hypothetical protein
MTTPTAPLSRAAKLLALSALVALAACGSGSGGDTASAPAPAPAPAPVPAPAPSPAPAPAPTPTTDPKATAGFWSGRLDAQTTVSSVFLPEGQAWTVLTSTPVAGTTGTVSTLARGTISVANNTVTVAGTATSFGNPPAVNSYSLQGVLVPQSALNVPATVATPAYDLTYNKAFETPARLADAAGRWSASVSQGAIRVTLDINATGAITGSSTAGCTYSGSLATHPAGIAVFTLGLQEQCLNQVASSFGGIATLNAASTQLSLAFTAANGSQAGLLLATR